MTVENGRRRHCFGHIRIKRRRRRENDESWRGNEKVKEATIEMKQAIRALPQRLNGGRTAL